MNNTTMNTPTEAKIKMIDADGTINTASIKEVRKININIAATKEVIESTVSKIEKMVEKGFNTAVERYVDGDSMIKYDGQYILASKIVILINDYNKLIEIKNSAEEDLKEMEEELAKYEF